MSSAILLLILQKSTYHLFMQSFQYSKQKLPRVNEADVKEVISLVLRSKVETFFYISLKTILQEHRGMALKQ
jgi:hypothetical protein